jgi:AraC-like DNA-binding protein
VVATSPIFSSAPRSPLGRFIADVQVLRARPGERRRSIDFLPDGTTTLVFRALGSGTGGVSVHGPRTRAYYKTAPAIPLAVRVVFWPGGGYPFFGVPIDTLTDRIVSLADLWGRDGAVALERLLESVERGGDVTALLERMLLERMRTAPFEPASAVASRMAVTMLATGAVSVDQVARTLGISGRHLRRTFHATVGVGPKTYARFARFQRAITLGNSRPGRWSEIAREVGYFDQAHLTADFRELARVAPGSLESDVPRVRHAC